jgi:hypothetical protein
VVESKEWRCTLGFVGCLDERLVGPSKVCTIPAREQGRTIVAITRDHDPAQRQFARTTKPLSFLSAAWCGISLLAIGAFITAVLGDVLLKLLKTVFVSSEYQWVFVSIFFVAGVLGSLIVLALGVAFGRYLLRTLPFAMSDRGRGRSGAVSLYVVYISLYFLFLGIGETLLSFNATTGSYKEGEGIAIQLDLLLAMFWATGVIGLLIRRHRRLRSFLDRPFVVFLRRFSTFPDRAVIVLILKQAAYNVPVVFLTPTQSRPGRLGPVSRGFCGPQVVASVAERPYRHSRTR